MHLPVEQHGPNTPSFACGVTMQARPARALQPKELGATRQPKGRARLQVRRRQRQLSVTLFQFPGRKNSEQAYSSRIAPVLARSPSRPAGRPRVSTEHQEKIMSKSQTRGHTFPLTQRISPFPSPGNAKPNIFSPSSAAHPIAANAPSTGLAPAAKEEFSKANGSDRAR
jgi:hypothetical protein